MNRLLEPIYVVEVEGVPEQYLGAVIGDLSRRRALLEGQERHGDVFTLIGRVPLSEMDNYESHLRALTQGQATYAMRFDSYLEDPGHPPPS